MKTKLIIDTDPGHDDALAILLAARHFDILGITTVHGNQTVDRTTQNALKILEFSGLTHIPVVRGSDRPLCQPLRVSSRGHGVTGLDGPDLPEPKISRHPGHAVDFIIETVMAHEDVTLVCIGPLTNVGLALHREPLIAKRLREISLMGGSTTIGNTTPVSEFNICCDPEAAHIVFTSGVPIKMVGLNLTRQAEVDPARIERFRRLTNKTGRIVTEIVEWYSGRVRAIFGLAGASLHDPCAVAWLIDPTLIESQEAHVDIELRGEHTRGMTVCDLRFLALHGAPVQSGGGVEGSRPPNAEVGMKLDVERFFALLVEAIAQYP